MIAWEKGRCLYLSYHGSAVLEIEYLINCYVLADYQWLRSAAPVILLTDLNLVVS